ncbi:MAG: transketolase [Candidatus Magasanikbacteria bacterium]|nr:transketolase [Candidatus Magasanikbacteria bacterium]
MHSIPKIGEPLTEDHVAFLHTFAQSCRHSILDMVVHAQSGHPGGSLGCIDYLSLLYTAIISQTGEPVIISNGHISPAVYSVLAELGYIGKEEAITGFRKVHTIFEGHVSRHVPGVWYGTGPLGCGISAATGFALAEKMNNTGKKVYALIGDGETQEGQVYEAMHFARKYDLNNLIVFLDYNNVQLTDSVETIMPIDYYATFKAAGWHVLSADNGHDYQTLWSALSKAHTKDGAPTVIIGHTIMGKGVDFMEETGRVHQATWHGKAPELSQAKPALAKLLPTAEQVDILEEFHKHITWQPHAPVFPKPLSQSPVNTGNPQVYPADTVMDCRTAYGNALLDLVKHNPRIVALTADLSGSVKTSIMQKEFPERHIDVGVAEQHMVSCAGGLSLAGFVPFCSTFGTFMTSRAKDQARVNDINHTNVKMVATHCGLSVGEDGPTHQAIDDVGSMLGFFNTHIIEPADPNQCDHIIRYIAGHYGNFYVRMGRHKVPMLKTEDGTPLFGSNYSFTLGETMCYKKGYDVTLIAAGSMVSEAVEALDLMEGLSVELLIVSSPQMFDDMLFDSVDRTKRVVVVEDHNPDTGYSTQIAKALCYKGITPKKFIPMGVTAYQMSGTAKELYDIAGISARHIAQNCKTLI